MNRKDFLKSSTLLGAAALVLPTTSAFAKNLAVNTIDKLVDANGNYIQQTLPYSETFLEPYMDAETLHLHYTFHHGGAIKGANKVYSLMITFCLNSIHKLGYVFMLFFLSISANSQTFGTIKGMVSDKNNPLEYVNVILTKTVDTTKVIKFVTTDIAGKFLIDKIELGNYAVKFQLIGYKSYSQKVAITNENLNLVVNNITLNSELVLLNEVSIKTQKKLIEKTPQGFIVNASANITQAGGTATDLLKNTPTVSVDAEGSITLRGKSPLILVNGRNSNLGNPDQIPASSVESIEIINNATAKYDANAEGGIINIKLKKTNKTEPTAHLLLELVLVLKEE